MSPLTIHDDLDAESRQRLTAAVARYRDEVWRDGSAPMPVVCYASANAKKFGLDPRNIHHLGVVANSEDMRNGTGTIYMTTEFAGQFDEMQLTAFLLHEHGHLIEGHLKFPHADARRDFLKMSGCTVAGMVLGVAGAVKLGMSGTQDAAEDRRIQSRRQFLKIALGGACGGAGTLLGITGGRYVDYVRHERTADSYAVRLGYEEPFLSGMEKLLSIDGKLISLLEQSRLAPLRR